MTGSLTRSAEERRIWNTFRHHSRTFSLAARLLPAPVRMPVATLYLFCRAVDTVADHRVLEVGAAAARAEVEDLRTKLDAALAGRPPREPLWLRLADVHARYGLPRGPLYELLDGAAWDLDGHGIATRDDLIAYSELVGGSVGAMMLPFLVPDADEARRLLSPARGLGVAMQITNILRDVGEDARELDRVYLPADWLEETGIARDAFACGRVPDGYPALVERAAAEAEARYAESTPAIDALPRQARYAIRAAARMYREILNEVRARGYDNLTQRAYVPLPRKIGVLLTDGYASRRASLQDGAPAAASR